MNDPFFDEDDGEFDDLYGNLTSSASFPTATQQPQNHDILKTHPDTPGSTVAARSSMASSSIVLRSVAHDRRDSITRNTMDCVVSGKPEKRRKHRGKLLYRASQELFDVKWESDVKVAKCGLCKLSFSLVKRKHHCRHCGRIMCSDCSSFLYFEHSRRKHRVCSTCNNHLLAEQEAYERETMPAGDATSSLFADLRDGEPALPARTLMSNGDDNKAAKKQKETRRKELKRNEKLQRHKEIAKSPKAAPTSQKSAIGAGIKLNENQAAACDDRDEDWLIGLPDQQTRSYDSVDVFSDSDTKGSGWRERARDAYTIAPATKQMAVLAPMAGSSLTTGITESGDISDQFQYDFSRRGWKREDEISVGMPRPEQQIVAPRYTDHSVMPKKLSRNDYLSSQFQYDDVGGPGLGHDDDCSVAMPRPTQELMTTRCSYKDVRHSQNQLEPDSADDSHGLQARLTFTKRLSAREHQESIITEKREWKATSGNPRVRGNQPMALNGLNSLPSSQDGLCTLASTGPSDTAGQPTFYGHNIDALIVTELPGYFEATIEEREAEHKKAVELNEQLARDMAWASNSSLHPPVRPHRFSSDHNSDRIVNLPSHDSTSPMVPQKDNVNDISAGVKAKSGFTGALKRFFSIGSKKATAPMKPAKTPRAAVAAPPSEGDSADNHTAPVSETNLRDHTNMTNSVSDVSQWHAVVKRDDIDQKGPVLQEKFRDTMTARSHLDAHTEVSLPQQVDDMMQHHQKHDLDRKRRGTFDELFMSPKNSIGIDTFSARDCGWTAPVAENVNIGQASSAAVGVARFDQRRPDDEAGDFVFGNEPQYDVPSSHSANDVVESWRESNAVSLLNDNKAATQSENYSSLTWSNIRPGLGTATYAVPTSLQSAAVDGDTIEMSTQNATPATRNSIMKDLKYGLVSKKLQGKELIDDFFADFEESNDYVFDSITGGYVAARIPARGVATKNAKHLESTELIVPEKLASETSNFTYSNQSPISEMATATSDGEEVENEVDEVIVSKISSLESELAVLKNLIRTRKRSERGQLSNVRVSRNTAKPRISKESIFDSDSSDKDDVKETPYTSSGRPAMEWESKRRPDSKKKFATARKDSFADLFEDSPNAKNKFGGAASYEELFQTKTKLTDVNKDDVSDNEADPTPSVDSRAAKLSRFSWESNDSVLSDDIEFGPKLALRKERQDKQSSRWKTRDDMDDPSPKVNEGLLVTTPSRQDAKQGSTNQQLEEFDPIDALFDTSTDRDVTKLYGRNDGHDGDDKDFMFELNTAPISDKSVLFKHESSSDAGANDSLNVTTVKMEPVAYASEASYSDLLDSQGLKEADKQEELLIHWAQMEKDKLERHYSPSFSSATAKNNIDDSATRRIFLEPSSEDWDFTVNGTPAKHAVSTALLADASSGWMSVGVLEDKTVSFSPQGEDYESRSVSDSKDIMESATENVVTNEKNQAIDLDIFPVPAFMNSPNDDAVPDSIHNMVVLAGKTDGLEEQLLLANSSLVDKSSNTTEKLVVEDDAASIIYDKSRDVEFSSASSRMSLETLDQKEAANDRENAEKEMLGGNYEPFSFEMQTPKQRSSGNTSPSISSVQSASEYRESLPSPTSSADDGVELYNCTPSSILPSPRISSLDNALDVPKNFIADDGSILGDIEVHLFDTDWQQMQVEEKERKKRLQVKQRQARRDKLIRKPGAKPLTGSVAAHGSSKSKTKSVKKKKKDNEKDDAALFGLHHKKSGSSQKHRRDGADSAIILTPSEPPRSLTEL